MPPRPESRSARKRRTAAALLAAAGGMCTQPSLAAADFSARIAANANYTDNVELASDNAARIDSFIFELTPSFGLEIDANRLRTALRYELQSLHYAADSDLDTTYHQASLGSELIVLPEWFSIIAEGAYRQRVVNPERTLNFDNLFATGDLTDETSASVSPTLRHEFGKVAVEAAYTRGIVDYSDIDLQGDLDDSDRDTYRFTMRQADDGARVSWEIDYRSESVSYDTAAPYEYDRASAFIGVPLGRRLIFLANGGSETDVSVSTTSGGLDSSFWRAGLRLEGDPRTQMEVWYGHRFFGDTYEARFARRASRLTLAASYTEEPQTEAERRTRIRPESVPVVVPETDGRGFRPTAEPYLLKLGDLSLTLEGRVTTVALTAFTYDQQYVRIARGEENRGASLQVTRRFGPRTEGSFSLQRTETYFAENPLEADDSDSASLGLTRRLSETFVISARALYLKRKGPAAGDYDATVFTVGLAKTF